MKPPVEPAVDAVLAAHADVDDGVPLLREGTAGSEVVAYVVPRAPLDVGELTALLRSATQPRGLPVAVVPIAAVPLDPEGRVDVAALERVPVVDDAAMAAWEARLSSLEPVEEAVVVRAPARRARPLLHVSDVLRAAPRSARESPSPAGPSRPGRQEPAPSPVGPAVSDGPPLRSAPGDAATLAETLVRAAEGEGSVGVRYVNPDLSSSPQTYAQLQREAERVLGGLRSRGIRAGSRVIFQFRDNRDFLTAFWGCVLGGFVPVPVAVAPTFDAAHAASEKMVSAWRMLARPTVLCPADLAPVLRGFAARHGLEGFVVHAIEDLLESEPDGAIHPSEPGDVAVLMLTSGSTGAPKGVKLTHRNLVSRSRGSIQANGFTRHEVTLNWMPLDHVAALLFFHLRDVHLACAQIQCPTDLVLGEPLRWLDLIDRHRCTVTFAPNFAFGLVNELAGDVRSGGWDLSSMRCVLNGAESIVAKTARTFLSLLVPHGLPATAMVPAWGMSETSSGVTYSRAFSLEAVRDADPFVSVGRPIAGVSLRIVDDADRIVEQGVQGHLQVCGSTLMAGYHDASLDAPAFTPDRWFRTGDLGSIRDGALTITGRAKDVIIVNSVNYYSHELEAAVEEVPGVTRSFAAACAVRGEGEDTDQLAVFLHTEETGPGLVALVGAVRQSCVRHVGIAPEYVVPVSRDRIPKTEIGKIQRQLLARRFAAGELDDARRSIDLLLRNERTLPDWFHRPTWRRSEARIGGSPDEHGTWLLLTDREDLRLALSRELSARGIRWVAAEAGAGCRRLAEERWAFDPDDPGACRQLLTELRSDAQPITTVLYLWTWGSATPDSLVAQDGQEPSRLLHWIQALAAQRPGSENIRLLVASTGARQVLEGEGVVPERAALLGLVKSAPQELPWLDARHVDLPPGDPEAAVTALLAEAALGPAERDVAYRDGRRWVAGLERVAFPAEGRGAAVERGGFYLVTGGLGGLGVELARHLLEGFDARVLLVGRSPILAAPVAGAEEDGLAAARLAAYRSLEGRGGTARYAAVDVSDTAALRRAVEEAEEAWGRELGGAFHLAGRYEERALVDETAAGLEASLLPKLAGVRAVATLLDQREGAFLVAFSTAISVFGGAMVGAYAAANSALEAFLVDRANRAAGRTVCVGWSRWQDIGISRAFLGTAAALREKGYESVGVRQGMTSLLGCLRLGEPLVHVGLDASAPNVRRRLQEPPYGLDEVSAFYTTDDSIRARAEVAEIALEDRFATRLACSMEEVGELPRQGSGIGEGTALATPGNGDPDAALEAPETDMERVIAGAWSSALRREISDVRHNFFDIGGNSLLMSRVRARLSTELGKDVSLTDMFQYPTVRSLALHLVGAKDGPSPELETSQSLGRERRRRLSAARRGEGAR